MSQAASSPGSKSLPVAAGPAFLVSSSPHLASGATTPRIMFEVVAAMIPALIAALIFFRGYALAILIPTLLGCLAAEALANWLRGRDQSSLKDGSAIVTGMILAFSLPPMLNPYMAFIGGAISILLAKAVFGGLGHNLFNPAMVGRAFLMVCFPAAMGVWTEPSTLHVVGDVQVDGVTMATPLQAAVEAAKDGAETAVPALSSLFVGNVAGCVGETSALAILVGGLWLVLRGVADWRQPVGVLASVAIFATIGHWAAPDAYQGPLFHLTSGALLFGAFFIATDYVGAPVNPTGRLIFGVGTGVLIMVIRQFGAYPEGVMFAILIMNALTPMIERITTPTPFGGHVK